MIPCQEIDVLQLKIDIQGSRSKKNCSNRWTDSQVIQDGFGRHVSRTKANLILFETKTTHLFMGIITKEGARRNR